MSKNELKIWPDPSLSTACTKVTDFSEICALLDNMTKTMKLERGLGLAANQIGINLQIIIMRSKDDIIEIINPEIISTEGEQFEDEGCLSFKHLFTKIKRPLTIHFKCVNKNNEIKEYIAYGKEAQCLAHELDHLSGLTILNHANRQEKKRILKELEKK